MSSDIDNRIIQFSKLLRLQLEGCAEFVKHKCLAIVYYGKNMILSFPSKCLFILLTWVDLTYLSYKIGLGYIIGFNFIFRRLLSLSKIAYSFFTFFREYFMDFFY